ncbi:HAMP domain-containing sensor histidine kinase [Paenibacillus gansuensis]|uniref:histidine kinase n=1 Tax=Paenibacillus gansuensis TaxID=306542 RepID=A0ABW5PI98_9BACL
MIRLKHSLLSQYLLIVLSALVLLPLMIPVLSVSLMLLDRPEAGENVYRNGLDLEEMWHKEAAALKGHKDADVNAALYRLQATYPKARMFWVDGQGNTRLQLPKPLSLPEKWTAAYTISFMKQRTAGDPFTVVAFIGEERGGGSSGSRLGPGSGQGFMVFEVPRSEMRAEGERLREDHSKIFVAGTLAILGLFLFISLLFFYRIRKRLVRLQAAMTAPTESGIPEPVKVENRDEIGRLESAFADMVGKLEASRRREAEEEALRRDLIAKLSHDLRTPLTTIGGLVYRLKEEPLSAKGMESLRLIERKMSYLGQLIENLFSYSLLTAGVYPYKPQETDIVRLVRTLLAQWYPLFEKEGFEIEPDFPETSVLWRLDPQWLERVVDNYLQNVLRHAGSGKYIRVSLSAEQGGSMEISDRGPGLNGVTEEKGAGIGLTIAALMLKEMSLRADVSSSEQGTTITIMRSLGRF